MTQAETHVQENQSAALVAMVPRITVAIFCDNAQSAAVMQQVAADRRMSKAQVDVFPGGIAAATQHFSQEATPNVVIVESHGDRNAVMAELGGFAEVCGANTRVIVLGHVNDILLYRELMKNHVSDYIVAPFTAVQIIGAIAAIYSDPKAAPLGRVIAFVGAKGGVGSSTIAHNISYALANKFKTETILTDLDLSFGTAALNFNHEGGGSFVDALASPERVDGTLLERLMSRVGNKLSLLNGPCNVDRDFVVEPHAVETVLNVVRQAAPMIVVDVPNMWSPWVKYTLMNADDIVVTAPPELPALRNAKNLMDLLKVGRPNDKQPRLVLNQVGVAKRPEIQASDFAKALGTEAAAVIPYDAVTFGQAQGNGQMLFEVAPKAPASEILAALAGSLMGVATQAPKKAGAKSGLSGLLNTLPLLKKKG
jgi:pilus assembly protein CpaE